MIYSDPNNKNRALCEPMENQPLTHGRAPLLGKQGFVAAAGLFWRRLWAELQRHKAFKQKCAVPLFGVLTTHGSRFM